MNKGNRLVGLDILKILGTIIIVFHHYQQVMRVTYSEGINFFSGKFYWGYITELFFVISGIVAISSVNKIKNGLKFSEYITYKLVRLLPLTAVTAVSYEIFLYLFIRVSERDFLGACSLWGTISSILGVKLGGSFNSPPVNGPSWYIYSLIICYVILYFSIFLSDKLDFSHEVLWVIMIFVGSAVVSYGIDLPYLDCHETGRAYYAFFWGLLIGAFINSKINYEFKKNKCKNCIIACVIIVCLVAFIIRYWEFSESGINFTCTYVLYPLLIYVICELTSNYKSKIIEFFADVSFNVFLWHEPFMIVLWIVIYLSDFSFNYMPRKVMFAFTMIIYFIGILSHIFIEEPLTSFLKKSISKKEMMS